LPATTSRLASSSQFPSTSLAYDQLTPSTTQKFSFSTSLQLNKNISKSSTQTNSESSSFPWLYFGIGLGGSLIIGFAGGIFCRTKYRNSLTNHNASDIQLIENRLDRIEQRLDILDGKLLTLADSMKIIDNQLQIIDQQASQGNSSSRGELSLDKIKAQSRRKLIQEFDQNPDLKDFYQNLISHLNNVYLAAKVVQSNIVVSQSTDKFQKGSKVLSSCCEAIPVIGDVASQIVGFAGSFADSYQNAVNKQKLLRITQLCDSISEFENIALRIAVEITNANKSQIIKLNQAKIKANWKSYLKTAITEDAQTAFLKYLDRNNSQASILGIAKANQIISYLTNPEIARDLRRTDSQGLGTRFKRRESVIANKIIQEVSKISGNNSITNEEEQSGCLQSCIRRKEKPGVSTNFRVSNLNSESTTQRPSSSTSTVTFVRQASLDRGSNGFMTGAA